MIFILVSIRDRAVEAFQPVGCSRSEGEAIRGFQDIINNPQNQLIYNHPDDYDLYTLGHFDDHTGAIETHAPKKIADGKQLKMQGA